MTPGSELGAVSPHLRKSISEHNSVLATYVAAWLRKRGKALRPRLNDEQKAQLEECFELMDADGSGAIDADELGAAFKLLGIQANRAEISELLAEVDSDGSGEVEYPEFIQIMTSTLAKLSERKEQEGSNQVPFSLLATAYRRKRLMEGLTSGNKDMTTQVMQIAEEAARKAADEAAIHCSDGQSACSSSSGSTGGKSADNGQQASRGLLRALTKAKSVKLAETSGDLAQVSGSSSRSASGSGSVACFISTLVGEPEAAKLLGDLLRQHVQHKSPDHVAADHQQQQKIAIADGGSGLHADKQGLFNTHMTSKLQRLQLTQDIEVPKYVLNHRANSPSCCSSPSARHQVSRSPPRMQPRTSGIVPLSPGSLAQASNRLGLELTHWQEPHKNAKQAQSMGVQDARLSLKMPQQQQREGHLSTISSSSSSNSGGGGGNGSRSGRTESLQPRRSKSYSNLSSAAGTFISKFA